MRFGTLGGQSRSLAAGIAARLLLKMSCVSEVSLRVEFINLLRERCFNYHHRALHQLIFVFCYHRTIIDLHILPTRNCDWKT